MTDFRKRRELDEKEREQQARVSYEITPCVRVDVMGERSRESRTLSCPQDRGVVGRLLEFMRKQRIYSLHGGLTVGGGIYSAMHYPEDAEKIRAWLASQDVAEAVVCRHCGRSTHPHDNVVEILQETLDSELVQAGLRCPVCWAGS